MKLISIMALFFVSTAALANETTRVECISATKSGKIIKLSFCHDDKNDLTACAGEDQSFVTTKRETETLKGLMRETLQLPTEYFYLTREEELTRLEFGSDIGKLELNFVGGDQAGGTLEIKVPNFDHRFNAVNCTFN